MKVTAITPSKSMIDEITSLNNKHLMAVERSFFNMISTGKKGLKMLIVKNASEAELTAQMESIETRKHIYSAISNELSRRIGYEVCISFPNGMKYSSIELHPGEG